MKIFNNLIKKREEQNSKRDRFEEMLKNGGQTIALGKAKYLGGHADIMGEKIGNLTINGIGVFFSENKKYNFFYIPVGKILQSDFKTGEQIARNAVFSRLLALGGFSFAYKKKTREKRMFLTIDYMENGVESTVLFETDTANEFASAISRIRQDAIKLKNEAEQEGTEEKAVQKTVSELMKEINELRALGILTIEEFTEKKRDLLSRL